MWRGCSGDGPGLITAYGVARSADRFRSTSRHRTPEPVTTNAGVFAGVEAANITAAEGRRVMVEVDVGSGLPTFQMVGVPDTAYREARDRIGAAITSSGLGWPNRPITVNLTPIHQRTTGSVLDLAMAVVILAADEQVPPRAAAGLGCLGEVRLDGCGPNVPIGAAQVAEALSMRIDPTTAMRWSSP